MYLKYWKGRWFRELVEDQFVGSVQCHHVWGGTILTVKDMSCTHGSFDIKLKDFEALYITEPNEIIEVCLSHAAAERALHASCLMKTNTDNIIVYMHRDARDFPAGLPFRLVEWRQTLDIIKRRTDSPEWRAEGRANAERDSMAPNFQRAMEELYRRTLTDVGAWSDDDDEPAKATKRLRKRKAVPVAPPLPCRRIIIKGDRPGGEQDAGHS